MSRLILVLVFGLFFFGFVSGVSVDDSIYEQFDNGEAEVRVIMKVNNDTQMPRGFGVFGFKKFGVEGVVGDDDINKKVGDYVSAYIDKDELDELVKNDMVEDIGVEQIYHTMLQDSVGVVNASSAWGLEVSGVNLTGTGQTVCVIDSGVNYSHSDFGGCYGNNDPSSSCVVIGGWDFCGDDGDCAVEDDDPMDVYGHGTHVSGIISANGGISGVGPGTKIVAMKTSNASGIFFTVNIVAAIDWCVNNASVFNISVISMSLGGGQYTDYCDGADSSNIAMTNSINNAVANNISVVVATGNTDGSYPNPVAGISSPACIENVTRITASTKSDLYASYAFRYANFPDILVAPGSSINSTVIGGGYGFSSGTSMAAPMVAGVIAIINQYLGLSGQTKTTDEVENVLNSNGVVLDDSGESGYNFSRVDVYSALLSLDVVAPNVMLVSPVDDNVDMDVNRTFVCNATDWQLENLTLNIWNSSGLYYNVSENVSGFVDGGSFNVTNINEGSYFWNCLGVDVLGNSAFASANFSFTVGGISTTLVSPVDDMYANVNDSNFSCRVVSESNYSLSNVTFYLWNSSGLVYNLSEDISGVSNTSVFNYSFVGEGNYSWNCLGVNNGTNSSWGVSNYSFVFDVTVPDLVLMSSPSGATASSISRSFGFNVSDDNLANCSLVVGGVVSLTNSSMNVSLSQVFSRTFMPGTYAWRIDCSDFVGNVNSSSDGSFVITAPPVGSSGGGGGGGGGGSVGASSVAEVYSVSVAEVRSGYTKKLKKDDGVNFSVFDFEGGRHLLSVDEVGVDYVNLTIMSDPINLKLGVGQSVKLNLTSPVYYDLLVKLNAVVEDAAELTIQLINEPIEIETVGITGDVVAGEAGEVEDYSFMFAVLVILFVLVILVASRVHRKKLKGSSARKKNGKKIKT